MPPASPTNQERKEDDDEGTEEADEGDEEGMEEDTEEEEEEEEKELLLPTAPAAAAPLVPSPSHSRSTIELAAQQRSHTSHAHSLHPCMYLRRATRGDVYSTHTPG